MSEARAKAQRMTEAEYLERSVHWETPHEWVNGEVWAMSGGSPRHAAVILNVGTALQLALRGRPCRATSPAQRVYVDATRNYFFTDVMVVCGPFQTPEHDWRSVQNPSLIVEVLSPSTRDYDAGTKFDNYRLLPSLSDYVLVDPERPHVVHHARTEPGWLRRDLHEGVVRLETLGVELTFEAIYADLDNVPAAPVPSDEAARAEVER